MTPALAAEYTAPVAMPTRPASLATATMLPRRSASIDGSTARRAGEHAPQVHGQRTVPVGLVGVDEQGRAVAAGAADEHVDGTVHLDGRGDPGTDRRGVGDVDAEAEAVDLLGDVLGPALVEADDGDPGALGGEAADGGLADAGVAARHEGMGVGEPGRGAHRQIIRPLPVAAGRPVGQRAQRWVGPYATPAPPVGAVLFGR